MTEQTITEYIIYTIDIPVKLMGYIADVQSAL